MLRFIIKRLVYTLLAIPLVVFFGYLLFSVSPIDPVERLIDRGEYQLEKSRQREIYIKTAKNHKLNLPPFYFVLNKKNYQKAYYSIIFPDEKKFYKRFLDENYSYQSIESLYNKLFDLQLERKDANLDKIPFLENFTSLNVNEFHSELTELSVSQQSIYSDLLQDYNDLKNTKSIQNALIPKFIWLGKNNSYHHRLREVFTGDLGNSIRDGRSVYTKLAHAFSITLFMVCMSVFFSLIPGIYIGKKMALHDGNKAWKLLEWFLFLLRSIPLFWFLTLCLIFLTTPEYSKFLHIFPSVNAIGFSSQQSFLQNILRNGNQLLLPIIGVAIFQMGYISRQVKTLLNRENNAPYLVTARMKGLSKNNVQKHAFKNTTPQIITMISTGVASAFSGSVVVEFIFNIPGMGRLLLDSIRYSDFPMLMTIIVFLFILTSIIFTIADVLYKRSDPRIQMQYE